jgi:hypothetical protein
MANDAYKILGDTTFPRPLRTVTTVDNVEIEETTGQAYAAGEYVLASELSQRDRERAENGELDHLLESVSEDEALSAREAQVGLFIPEHEVERYAMLEAGHRVIEKDQVLDLRAAGADAAREALEASKDGPDDANPAITEQPSFVEVPAIAQAQLDGEAVLPKDHDREVSDYEVETAQSSSDAGVEMPPGLPVGPTLAKAEGADPEKTDEATEKSAKKTARRAKPGSASTTEKKDS